LEEVEQNNERAKGAFVTFHAATGITTPVMETAPRPKKAAQQSNTADTSFSSKL